MNGGMLSRGNLRRRPRSGVANIIATIFLVAITVVAGVILWSFKINTPGPGPTVEFSIRSGTSNPVWGDPTDCLPWFPAWLNYNTQVSTVQDNTTADYYENGGNYALNTLSTATAGAFTPIQAHNGKYYTNNFTAWWAGGFANISGGTKGSTIHNTECSGTPPTGDFSVMNSTQFIVASHSPDVINLNDIEMIFICNNSIFVNGTLASMTWYPGSSTQPSPDAPHLGRCGTFVPSGSYSTLYNRFGIFVPVSNNNSTILNNGDTFVMYVHTSSPFDPDFTGQNQYTDSSGNTIDCGPGPDCDDFHGAPQWCFTVPTACTLTFVYLGNPQSTLATIPLYNIIRG
jgi:hypothetical protein